MFCRLLPGLLSSRLFHRLLRSQLVADYESRSHGLTVVEMIQREHPVPGVVHALAQTWPHYSRAVAAATHTQQCSALILIATCRRWNTFIVTLTTRYSDTDSKIVTLTTT